MAEQAQESRGAYDVTEHLMSIDELTAKYGTALNLDDIGGSGGLTQVEADKRYKEFGPNAMRPPKKTPEIIKYFKQYLNPFMLLLTLASVLCYIVYGLTPTAPVNLYCGIALSVIVFGQSTVTYLEERKSNGVMDSLKKMVPSVCKVIRDGQVKRVEAALLVVGDLVQLKGGDRVPADIRIVQTSGLKTECSSLTGEPDAHEVTVTHTHEEPHESKNIAFSTAQCTEGAAYGIVVRTSDKTLIGMVAVLASDTSTTVTTLQREVLRVVYLITIMAAVMAILILIIGLCQKLTAAVVINLVITIFCANIPQGLPATVTSCLGIAAKRMFHRNVLVKNLEVIETLGSATCIASDKTGTLTQNKMTVQNFWFNGGFEMLQGGVVVGIGGSTYMKRSSSDGGRRPSAGSIGGINSGSVGADFAKKLFTRWRANPLEPILLVAAVCNSAKYAGEGETDKDKEKPKTGQVQSGQRNTDGFLMGSGSNALAAVPEEGAPRSIYQAAIGEQEIVGDASEAALMRYCDCVYPVENIRALYPRVFDQPFNSTVKYAMCIVDPPADECPGKQYAFLKGAPEVVTEKCTTWLSGGHVLPIDEEFKNQFTVAYERFASNGERVLGFARLIVDKRPSAEWTKDTVPTTGYQFLGLASLMDPPKNGVDQAVLDCHTAGIRVYMVTGDHALTAEAIARKVNIITLATRKDIAEERGCTIEEVDPEDEAIEAVVVTGSELKKYDENKWKWLFMHKEIVFARTTPTQKLEIVEHLQARGEVVAVTGDGVNDSPALKKADIGVAMGNPNASDVAREAADIIILDDDFCSIVHAIKEGRLLFDNLKKSICYTITHLLPEIVPVALSIILLFPLGLSSLLILTIDLGSELVPAISLAYEMPESAIMQRPPRNVKVDRMITKQVIWYSYACIGIFNSVMCMLSYFTVFWNNGISLTDLLGSGTTYWMPGAPTFVSGGKTFNQDAQLLLLAWCNGAWYAVLIVGQMFHLWFCRTRLTSVFHHPLLDNRMCVIAMVWEVAFILVFVYIPQFAPIFVSGLGLDFRYWLFGLGTGAFIFAYSEITKWAARQKYVYGNDNCLQNLAW